ncbi:MAG: Crp/Fnr family transcriptional regulator [Gammaproteobacteria bacterium]
MSQKPGAKSLLQIFESLDTERQNSLLHFAEYLQSKGGLVTKEIGEPQDIPRPESETVVGAIKRLKQTYPMVESMTVFSAASSLMTDHMVKGRDANEVINDMEKLFDDFYRQMLQGLE